MPVACKLVGAAGVRYDRPFSPEATPVAIAPTDGEAPLPDRVTNPSSENVVDFDISVKAFLSAEKN